MSPSRTFFLYVTKPNIFFCMFLSLTFFMYVTKPNLCPFMSQSRTFSLYVEHFHLCVTKPNIFMSRGHMWLNVLGSWITKQLIPTYHQYGVGSHPLCKLQKGCTRLAAASDKVYQLLTHGLWFSPGTPTSSTTKTGRHDIAEILLKVALSTKYQSINLYVTKSNSFPVYH